jgi:F0F1-type ATP synthase assembly protein I
MAQLPFGQLLAATKNDVKDCWHAGRVGILRMNKQQQVETGKKKALSQGVRYLAIATQLPFAVVAGYFLGYGLDHVFGTTWLKIACLILAIIGAFAQIISQVTRDQSK